MILEEMNPQTNLNNNNNNNTTPTALDATQISVLIPTGDEFSSFSAQGQGLGAGPGFGQRQGLGSSSPRDDIPPATDYAEKSLQPPPYESPFPSSRRSSRRLIDQVVFPEFPSMNQSDPDFNSSTQIRFLGDDEDPSVLLESNPMKNPASSTIATNPLNTTQEPGPGGATTTSALNGPINSNIWPWFIPPRLVFIRNRPDFFFPERVYQLNFLQRVFVFFEHPKASRLGTVYFLLLICVIVLGVVSLVLATENAYLETPTTCADPACNNDPKLCPGTTYPTLNNLYQSNHCVTLMNRPVDLRLANSYSITNLCNLINHII